MSCGSRSDRCCRASNGGSGIRPCRIGWFSAASCTCCTPAFSGYLPTEMGFGSGMTCRRRLRDWNEAGVWQRLHAALLAELNAASRLDWSRCVVDSSHVRALKGGIHTGPSPVDRGRVGSKHHLITDGRGRVIVKSCGSSDVRSSRSSLVQAQAEGVSGRVE